MSSSAIFHPHDVAFLLIDYKGGGMGNLFKDLPHLLGTITNLDGAQSMRALVPSLCGPWCPSMRS
ncbi:FtsK/SpoIIIE domain-containing protein [Streptococcus suis]|nr:FtsK/SpoIIIE domain-containing protein [Streptococcus suis]